MAGKLQIISGKYRGRRLKTPGSARPTQQLARGAVMNMLDGVIAGRGGHVVWDAFAGSGAMGLEFVSRFGAARAAFTDASPEAAGCVAENARGIEGCEIIVRNESAAGFAASHPEMLRRGGLVVFVDPPYSDPEPGAALVADMAIRARSGTIVVWEVEAGAFDPPVPDALEVLRDRRHGRARLLILRKSRSGGARDNFSFSLPSEI